MTGDGFGPPYVENDYKLVDDDEPRGDEMANIGRNLFSREVMDTWRARHSEWASKAGAAWTAGDYAYGVVEHRLGARASVPSPGYYVGNADRGNRKAIRGQVDAIIAELRGQHVAIGIDERPVQTDDGWIIFCTCGWQSEPQDTEDDAEDEHSGHCNEMARPA